MPKFSHQRSPSHLFVFKKLSFFQNLENDWFFFSFIFFSVFSMFGNFCKEIVNLSERIFGSLVILDEQKSGRSYYPKGIESNWFIENR